MCGKFTCIIWTILYYLVRSHQTITYCAVYRIFKSCGGDILWITREVQLIHFGRPNMRCVTASGKSLLLICILPSASFHPFTLPPVFLLLLQEVDKRWSEYQSRFSSLLQWSRQHTALMANKNFPQNPVELKVSPPTSVMLTVVQR